MSRTTTPAQLPRAQREPRTTLTSHISSNSVTSCFAFVKESTTTHNVDKQKNNATPRHSSTHGVRGEKGVLPSCQEEVEKRHDETRYSHKVQPSWPCQQRICRDSAEKDHDESTEGNDCPHAQVPYPRRRCQRHGAGHCFCFPARRICRSARDATALESSSSSSSLREQQSESKRKIELLYLRE